MTDSSTSNSTTSNRPRPPRSATRTAQAIWRRLGLLGAERGAPQPRPLTLRAATVIFVLAIVLAYLFVGAWFTIVTAVLAIVTVRFNPDPGRPFAFATVALIVAAAFVSTVLVRPGPTDPTILFAQARHLAAQLGSFAGVFFAIATMMYAVAERPVATAAPPVPPPGVLLRRLVRVARSDLGIAFGQLGLIALAVVVGGAVRWVLAPEALPSSVTPLVQNLRLGTTYSLELSGGAQPTAAWPPLGAALVAYLPVGAGLIAWAVSVVLIGAGAWAAWRWGGRQAGIVAAWGIALVPACWALSLNELLAALAVVLAVGVLASRPTPGVALVVGIAAGAAVVSRPDAVAALVVLAVALLVRARPAGGAAPAVVLLASVLAGAALVAAGWVNYTTSTFGFPYLAETMRDLLRDPEVVGRGGGLRLAGAAALVAAAIWGVVVATPPRRRQVLPSLVLSSWCVLTAVLTGSIGDPLSWSAPLLMVSVALLRPWEAAGSGTRSGRRDRTTTPVSDRVSTDEARR